MSEENKTVFSRLAEAREEFHALMSSGEIKQSGYNSFLDAHYFDLKDIVTPGLRCLKRAGLCSSPVTCNGMQADMQVIESSTGNTIPFSVPLGKNNLSKGHDSQNIGAGLTYARRYLWMQLMECVEPSVLDAVQAEARLKPTDPATEAQMDTLRAAYKAGQLSEDATKTLTDKLNKGKTVTVAEASSLITSLSLEKPKEEAA